jgi:CHAT domain-containing protein
VKFVFSRKGLMLCAGCLALLSFIGVNRLVESSQVASSFPLSNDPSVLLDRANHFAWLGNWNAAGPLYARAEVLFHTAGDRRNELYSRVGGIAAYQRTGSGKAPIGSLDEVLSESRKESDAKLRLWCLAAKGYGELNVNTASAKRAWGEALEIATTLGETQWATRASGELGVIAFLEGNTASAVSLVGRAILSAFRTGDIDEQVRLLSMLGNGFNEERRFSEALIMFDRAIVIAQKTPESGFPFVAYSGKATSLIGLRRTDEAQDVLVRALSVARSQSSRAMVAEILVGLGEASMAANDLDGSKAQLTEAQVIASQLNRIRTLADALFDLAEVDRRLGNAKSAMRALRSGLKASRRLGDRYYVPRDLTALAELQVARGNSTAANRLFEEAEDVLDGILINQHSFEENTARAGSMSSTYLEHFNLMQQSGDVGRALRVLERVRGRIVASHLYGREEFETNSPKLAPLEANIASTQLELLRTDDEKQRSKLLEQLLSDERNLAFELNEAGLNRHDMLAKPASLKIIQAALRKDELLLEYVLDEPHSFCIAITRESARIITLSADSKQMQTLTQAFLAELKSRGTGEQLGSKLYSLLLDPAWRVFHKPRLIISPDGILNLLPFEALQSHGNFIVRSTVVSYVPSATVLCALRGEVKPERGHSLLAVGAVDYNFRRAVSSNVQRGTMAVAVWRGIEQLSGAHLEDLPGSRDEVTSIAHIVGHDPTLMLGEGATESAFKSKGLSDFRIIHLAVHASSDPQYPDRAALVLGVAPKSTDDGLLQVREIMRLPLNADLVTLSACETGVGAARGESGVVSLEQAFLISGARAVVASLWNVEDRPTTPLMTAFYEHIVQGEDKASALANAKREMMDRYRGLSPYYWAPFVLVGEGAETVSPAP